jgi:hypothetical protein
LAEVAAVDLEDEAQPVRRDLVAVALLLPGCWMFT